MHNNHNNQNQNQASSVEKPIVEKLAEKVSLVLKKHHELTGDNEVLRNEIAELKATIEAKNREIEEKNKKIESLKEDSELKEMELEEIASKIESILG